MITTALCVRHVQQLHRIENCPHIWIRTRGLGGHLASRRIYDPFKIYKTRSLTASQGRAQRGAVHVA